MGNCLRLGISRVGLAWSKWRMSAKFKRKNISIIILGMQAVGKSTIALRLYKFKRSLPDTNYVQTKGFNAYTVKVKKTTVNIYDLGGHASIQELWDHYYADAHGIIYVVDTSERDTVPEAGRLLSKVLNDYRIRGKPVLLLANKSDLDGVSENELDSMLNLQQLVNSVRCLTRLDASCATDLKNDKGIFEGFKWLVNYIETNYLDLNNRVLSDTLEEKNREKARREAVKAARLAEEKSEENQQPNETPLESESPSLQNPQVLSNPPRSAPSVKSVEAISIPNLIQDDSQSPLTSQNHKNCNEVIQIQAPSIQLGPELNPDIMKKEPSPCSKIPLPLLPPINNIQPVKLPKLKSPKSRPDIISRIEVQEDVKGKPSSDIPTPGNSNDTYYDGKEFRFRQISAARRLSPEGADSDDGIVNLAYEPNEDLSSDSTPIGTRRHNFSNGGDLEYPNKELFMVTTLAEVHKEYFKDRKGSTSTHDSISMSMASEATDSIYEEGQSESTLPQSKGDHESKTDENATIPMETLPKPPTNSKGKKKRLHLKPRGNKTAPMEQPLNSNLPSPGKVGESLRNYPLNRMPLDSQQHHLHSAFSNSSVASLKQNSRRGSTASSKAEGVDGGNAPFTISNAWANELNKNISENSAEKTPVASIENQSDSVAFNKY